MSLQREGTVCCADQFYNSKRTDADDRTLTASWERSSAILFQRSRLALVPKRTTSGKHLLYWACIVILNPHSDYNFVQHNDECIPVGPEPIPAGVCVEPTDTYQGSSGFRKIPGNTCDRDRGLKLDDRVTKSCSNGKTANRVPSS